MKKIKLIILLVVACFFSPACTNNTAQTGVTKNINNTGKIDSIDEVTNKKGTLVCTRSATANNAEPFFKYTIDYKNNEILLLHSIEGITSSDSSILDEYETAYRKITNNYSGLKYYDSSVTRKDNTVKWETTINYDKIDKDALIALEGEDNNIIEDGKASLSTWLELAKKLGTTCIEE